MGWAAGRGWIARETAELHSSQTSFLEGKMDLGITSFIKTT